MLFCPKIGSWVVLKPGKVCFGLDPETAYEVVRVSKRHRSIVYVGHPGSKFRTGVHKFDVRYAKPEEIAEESYGNSLFLNLTR